MRFFRSKTPEENLIIHKNIPLNSRTNTDNVSICKCLMIQGRLLRQYLYHNIQIG